MPGKRPCEAVSLGPRTGRRIGRFLAGGPTKARPISAPTRIGRALRGARHARLPALAGVSDPGGSGRRTLGMNAGSKPRVTLPGKKTSRSSDATLRSSVISRPPGYNQYVDDIGPAEFVSHQTVDALELLDRNRPAPGETDLREFTWYHLLRSCRNERRLIRGSSRRCLPRRVLPRRPANRHGGQGWHRPPLGPGLRTPALEHPRP